MNVTPAYYLCSTGFCNCRVEFYHVCGANKKKQANKTGPNKLINAASLRQTKIIIRYIHIRYTRFLTEF